MGKHTLTEKLDAIKGLNSQKYELLMAMDDNKRSQRINGYITKMYALGFDEKYEDKERVQYNVEKAVLRAVDIILDSTEKLPVNGQYQALGMPFGIGYLLIECKDSPKIPKPRYGSSFG